MADALSFGLRLINMLFASLLGKRGARAKLSLQKN